MGAPNRCPLNISMKESHACWWAHVDVRTPNLPTKITPTKIP